MKKLLAGIFIFVFHSFGQSFTPDTMIARVTIRTLPETSDVYVDSLHQDLSPCMFHIPLFKPTIIKVAKPGFITLYDTLLLKKSIDTSIIIQLHKPSSLVISSVPEGANVFLSNIKGGVTPFTILNLPPDTILIAITKPFYETWTTFIVPVEGDSTHIIAVLRKREVSISVFVDPSNTSIYFDDKFVSHGSLVDYRTTTGSHKISLQNDSIGRKSDDIVYTSETQPYYFSGKLGAVSVKRGVFAALVPGSAQLADGAILKGGFMFAGIFALAYIAMNSELEYKDRLSQYDLAIKNYVSASTEFDASNRYSEVKSRKSDLDKYYTQRTVTFSLFLAGYLYSFIDALLNHLITDKLDLIEYFYKVPSIPVQTNGAALQLKVPIK
jgi:hypothetical protein